MTKKFQANKLIRRLKARLGYSKSGVLVNLKIFRLSASFVLDMISVHLDLSTAEEVVLAVALEGELRSVECLVVRIGWKKFSFKFDLLLINLLR